MSKIGQKGLTKNRACPAAPSTGESRVHWRAVLLVVLVLIGLNLFIYVQVRHFEFLGWDDPLYVTQNTEVMKGFSWQGVGWALTTGHAANWHPLTWLSLMLDVQLFGVSPGPIHFINVIFHIINSLLFFWVLFRLTSSLSLSAIVAGLFAAHPLHVESVAWIAERKDVLSSCFLLLTILAYTAYLRRPVSKRYFLVHALFALALMAKPMVISLPVLLLLLDYWPLRRASLQKGQGKIWLQLAREKLPLAIMAVTVSAVTITVQQLGGAVGSLAVVPFGTRVFNACISYVGYLAQMLWPIQLSAFYPFHPLHAWAVIGSILVLTAISFMAIRIATSHPYVLVGWAWYLLSLIPVIGLIQVGDQARADRYTYLPLTGIFIAIVWSAFNIFRGRKVCQLISAIFGCAVISTLAFLAQYQTGFWRNATTLWQHALETTTDNDHASVNLGMALMEKGAISEAIKHYNEALRIYPGFAEAHNALGVAFLRQNRISEATHHFESALRTRPAFWEAQGNMGAVLARQGKPEEAIFYFRQALAARPADAQLHHQYGLALLEMGKQSEAVAHFSESILLKPDFAEPHIQLGNILLNNGRMDEALDHYREAIRLKPGSEDAYTNIGIGLMNKGLFREAEERCAEALHLNPSLAEAHNCLGIIFARTGREKEAMDQYQLAIRLKPDYAEARNHLATVLINRMRDREALVLLAEAVKIRPDYVDALCNLATALINTGHQREAIPHLQRVLLIQPDNSRAKGMLTIALARQR
jgi:protein O-mannosyl-transferase